MESQGRWNVNIMADFCWTLMRDIPEENRTEKRNQLHTAVVEKRIRQMRRTK